jgi:hypothetical protein
MASRLRIIVLGYIVRGPLGGLVWHHLQYIMGLAELGHDVYFVEDSGDSLWCCYDPTRHLTDTDPTYGLQLAMRTFERVGLGGRWAYYDAHTSRWLGPCADRILSICATADLVLNLGGVASLRPWVMKIPVRALIDTDPVFTQIQHLTNSVIWGQALQHTAFLSFGENIGLSRCAIPKDGLSWQPARQPICLDAWPVTVGPVTGKFTTVMQWESYATPEYGRIRYGMKADSFGPYMDLPKRTGASLELAVGSPTAPRALLARAGWEIRNPLEVALDPWTYQQYIRQSKAEFTVAKHGYVISRSGWFSERSAAYLASGRPVVTQETGFSDWLEVGSGIIAFNTPEEALGALEEVNARYEYHCQAARAIAKEYFDARKVLTRLIAYVMNRSGRQPI